MIKILIGIALMMGAQFSYAAGCASPSGQNAVYFDTSSERNAACSAAASADGTFCATSPTGQKYCANRSRHSLTTTLFTVNVISCTLPEVKIYAADGQASCEEPDAPITCLINQSPVLNNSGEVESCLEQDANDDGCDSVGIINGIEYCAYSNAECTAIGGSYGYASFGEGQEPIGTCLDDTNSVPPSCASGSIVIIETGSPSTYSCKQPDQHPSNICDGTKYDCDGDGQVDDQNNNGVTDNGLSDEPLGTPTNQTYAPGQEPNIGYDELEPATEGEGDCDPSSQNYAECAGFNDAEDEEDNRGDQTGISSGATGDELASDIYTRLGNAPIVQAFSNVTNIFDLSTAACPSPNFSAFGTQFAFDYHCTLYQTISPTLSAVMLLFFSIVGLRHIASA